jgi:hypothetical protein
LHPKRSFGRWAAGGLLLVPVLALAACGGSSKSSKPTKAAITISPAGKSAKYAVPKSIKGGLVELTVTNQDKKTPHSAQLVLVEGNHTIQDAVKTVSSNSSKTPNWVRGEGGLGSIAPGASVSGTVNLPAGKYLLGDFAGPSSGPPAYTTLTVTKGKEGSLPSTPTTVDAATAGKDKFEWKLSGDALKAGKNTVTFKSGGKDSIHLVAAFRLTKDVPKAEIIKGLKSNGPPPKFVDQSSFYSTAVLDGGRSQTTPLDITKPGKWVLFCPLTDRDGGKPHFEEGLLKTVDVK